MEIIVTVRPRPRKIVVIVGSESDLPQCLKGLEWLRQAVSQSLAHVDVYVYVRSAHRHTRQLQQLLDSLVEAGDVDAIIAGAGKAAALPGCIDAYLRHRHCNDRIQVIGVAFRGGLLDCLAARLSITRVPGTQVRYAGLGSPGFLRACHLALEAQLPAIELPKTPPVQDLSLYQAIDLAERRK